MAGNDAHQVISAAGDSPIDEGGTPVTAEVAIPTSPSSQLDQSIIAYELLLLQQRLAAYERLHQEEMGELRREIERLSRAFLHQALPHIPSH